MDYRKESDTRIVIDDLLRKAGWDPDKIQVAEAQAGNVAQSQRRTQEERAHGTR